MWLPLSRGVNDQNTELGDLPLISGVSLNVDGSISSWSDASVCTLHRHVFDAPFRKLFEFLGRGVSHPNDSARNIGPNLGVSEIHSPASRQQLGSASRRKRGDSIVQDLSALIHQSAKLSVGNEHKSPLID